MKIAKGIFKTVGLALLAFVNLSMVGVNPYRILTDEDRFLEKSQDRPALSSGLRESPQWERYNEWHCFPLSEVEPSCVGVVWDQERAPDREEPMPSIAVSSAEGTMLFDYEEAHFDGLDCERVVADWKELLSGETSACIYGAYLEDADKSTTLWSLFGLKTSKGYWPMNKAEFFSTSVVNDEKQTEVE